MTNVDMPLLQSKLNELINISKLRPKIVTDLRRYIEDADDSALFRVNAIQYAKNNGLNESEVIDLFLYSAKLGIFQLEWNMVCPTCACIVDKLSTLNDVHANFICKFCGVDGKLDFDDYIQVVFTINPAIRQISFHQPKAIAPEDYLFNVLFARGVKELPNGLTHMDVGKMLIKHLQIVEPDQEVHVEMDVTPGIYNITELYSNASLAFLIADEQSDIDTINVDFSHEEINVKDRQLTQIRAEILQQFRSFEKYANLNCKKIHVNFKNNSSEKTTLMLVNIPVGIPIIRLEFYPCLTGKRLLTNQTFVNLFRSESLNANEAMKINDISVLFTDLEGSVKLYDNIGEVNAFHAIRQHFETLETIVRNNNGAIIKTMGDAVMAVFLQPHDGLKAALDIMKTFKSLYKNNPRDLKLRLGMNHGHSIIVSHNSQTDYFGQTVNVASRIQKLARSNEICLTKEVVQSEHASNLLKGFKLSEEVATLKGISNKIVVVKVTVDDE
jgi:class 3 adenylate cyclase